MGKLISKAEIFKKSAIVPKKIFVPAWESDVKYLPMNMASRRRCREEATSVDDQGNTQLDNEKLEIQAIVTCTLAPEDTDGTKFMFEMGDDVLLENQCAAGPLSVLSQAILQASGLGQEEVKSGKEEDSGGS